MWYRAHRSFSRGASKSSSGIGREQSSFRRRPIIDPLQRLAHEGGAIVLRQQAVRDAESVDPLLVGQ